MFRGVKVSAGKIEDEYLPELQEEKRFKVFREMSDDATIAAALAIMRLIVRSGDYKFEAADQTKAGIEAQELAEGMFFKDMSHTFQDFIDECMSMVTYGFAPFEVVWKQRLGPDNKDPSKKSEFNDGKFGIRKISLRSQRSVDKWLLDENNGIQGFSQKLDNGKKVDIPIERMLLMRTTTHLNNPEGRSSLRPVYRSWFLKKRIEDLEAIGIERDLAGYPIIYVPNDWADPTAPKETQEAYQMMVQIARDIKRDKNEGIVLPDYRDENGNRTLEVVLLSSGGSRQHDTDKIIQRYKTDILQGFLADFMMLGLNGSGTEALAKVKQDPFFKAMVVFANIPIDVINRHLMPKIWDFNGLNKELMPKLSVFNIEPISIEDITSAVESLSRSGFGMADADTENVLRRQNEITGEKRI